jgi:cytochrome c biogenesis protein CcmG, thiol:disulfide interchange protein DsbE
MNWRRATLGAAAALPIIALLAFGLSRDPRLIDSPLPGRDAPQFTLPLMFSEDSVRLADLRGHVVVLNFWASWCVPCLAEHPVLTDAAVDYYDQGVRFLGVLYRDSPENADRWIRRLGGASYPSAEDDGSRTAIDYGLAGVPETFVIDRDGTIVRKHLGPLTARQIAAYLDPLLERSAAHPAVDPRAVGTAEDPGS